MTRLQIIVGTVTGTAEGVAKYIERELSELADIELTLDTTVEDLTRDPEEVLLFCTSNTGAGDLPDNLLPLYSKLRNEPPNIAGRSYALINLGDSSFPTFGEAGVILHEALLDIGASSIAEPLLIDSSAERYPQKMALDWVREVLGAYL
ncbi:MAG: flavodoxin domain-containing protein [Pseudomonadota bacterium]